MAQLDVAAKADLALILPGFVLANYLNVEGVLPDLARSFHAVSALEGSSPARLRLADGNVVAGSDIVRAVVDLAGETKDTPVGFSTTSQRPCYNNVLTTIADGKVGARVR